MKQLPLFWLVMSICLTPLSAQNFAAVDKLALNTPPGKTTSVRTLAQYLCADQPDDVRKIRAIYAWITLHVAYVDSTNQRDLWATPEHLARQHPERVLQNRSAVCQGYANLFCALAREKGLPCEVVTGLVKNPDGEVEQIGHAWAAAQIEGQWRLFDPTWGVPPPGMTRWEVVDEFFMAAPQTFVLSHLPDDPMWQLLENPITERFFRESSDVDIEAFLLQDDERSFRFRDTLNHWQSMDSVARMFASEARVLQFNGSNDRVVFGLGQQYWGLFFDLRNTLDSLAEAAILEDRLTYDTLWFEAQIDQMDRYHERARTFFARLESEERIEKAEKFYQPEDVAAMLEKIRGDMHTGIFEHLLGEVQQAVLGERQLGELRYQLARAQEAYARAESRMDCRKLGGFCFEISHNRSLMAVQLAERQLRFAQELANEKTAAQSLKTIALHTSQARVLLLQTLDDCQKMNRRPPRFAFVDERARTARQGLLNLRICAVRVERTALSPEMEAALAAQPFQAKKVARLLADMGIIARNIDGLADSLAQSGPVLGREFAQIGLFNLQLENFALQFNMANLRFRLALHELEAAIGKNEYAAQKPHIKANASKALENLKIATDALDFLEDSGHLPAASIAEKQLKVNKLRQSLQGFLANL